MSALLACGRGLRAPTLFSQALVRNCPAQAPHRAKHTYPPRVRRSMGATFSASSQPDLTAMIKEKNAENPIMVYSKTYCPYCSEVKSLFSRLKVPYKVVELDNLADGAQVQAALQELTGVRTVPQVFVGQVFVGGCTDTLAAMDSGKLKELMQAAGMSV